MLADVKKREAGIQLLTVPNPHAVILSVAKNLCIGLKWGKDSFVVAGTLDEYLCGNTTRGKKCGVGSSDPKSLLPTPSPRFCGR